MWLRAGPAVVRIGTDGPRALVVSLADEGLAHAVAAGTAELQDAALAAASLPDGVSTVLTWRYTTLPLGTLPVEVADSTALDRLLGRTNRREPLLVRRRQSTDSLQQVFHIPADLAWFDGHFPGEPILAGVVQLKWAIDAARILTGGAAHPGTIQQLKFKSPIFPGSIVELAVKSIDGGRTVTFRYGSVAGEHSSARLGYGGS